jgi:hypothetical protein
VKKNYSHSSLDRAQWLHSALLSEHSFFEFLTARVRLDVSPLGLAAIAAPQLFPGAISLPILHVHYDFSTKNPSQMHILKGLER